MPAERRVAWEGRGVSTVTVCVVSLVSSSQDDTIVLGCFLGVPGSIDKEEGEGMCVSERAGSIWRFG